MAGHSKWANIKHRKGAQDKKRSGIFTKLAREIIVAAKSGADSAFNPRLRNAVLAAKSQGLPKDRIENAIKKGSGQLGDSENYEEIRYEGYAPGGVAVIVECLSDNRNRTASEVRSAFSKSGGAMGETGSVSFMFSRVGRIVYSSAKILADNMFETALEAGADNIDSDDEMHDVTCDITQFNDLRDALINKFGDPEEAKLDWKPANYVAISGEIATKVMNLLEALEDLDDVQHVSSNADFPEDLLATG